MLITNSAKRIKRHVIGTKHQFFIVTAPGFEPLCLRELTTLGAPFEEIYISKGGIEFQGRLPDCYMANLYLRTANRILMRVATVRSTRFFELEKKFSEIPWELYLYPGALLKIHTSIRHSRLFHTDGVSERLRSGIAKRFPIVHSPNVTPDGKNHALYIRGVDDRFTVSIDSTGDNLYKRGIKTRVGGAPLRETAAAAALMMAGYRSGVPLVDPMCGSGTFSLEAALIAKRIPPGYFRSFAFMEWPGFREKTWDYLKRQIENRFQVKQTRPSIHASDIDAKVCLSLQKCAEQFLLKDVISVSCKDFFDFNPSEMTERKGIVAINPPYGWRLGTPLESDTLFHAVIDRLRHAYRGWKLILIASNPRSIQDIPFSLRLHPIVHGGRRVYLLIGDIK